MTHLVPVCLISCLCVWNLYTASFCLDNKPESVFNMEHCVLIVCSVNPKNWVYSILGGLGFYSHLLV